MNRQEAIKTLDDLFKIYMRQECKSEAEVNDCKHIMQQAFKALNISQAIPISIAVGIIHYQNDVLIGKRTNIEEKGLYGFPGGKQHSGETVPECLHREVAEETGITINECKFAGFLDEIIHEHYLAMIYHIRHFIGAPFNLEPQKCEGWEWHNIDHLPPRNQWTKLFNMVYDQGWLNDS